MNRIYLLTGATGLLGSNISRRLIERGETVRALVLKDDPAVKYVPSGTQIVMGDVLDIPSLEEFFNVPDESECYIMANCLVSMKEMFEILNRALGINRKITILSVPVARLIAKIMAIGSKITGKPPKLTDFAIYNLTRNNNFDYSKAEKELGYKCRPFEETIFDEVRWLKEEGKI